MVKSYKIDSLPLLRVPANHHPSSSKTACALGVIQPPQQNPILTEIKAILNGLFNVVVVDIVVDVDVVLFFLHR